MCERAVKDVPCTLEFVPDHFKTQNMCNQVVKDEPSFLEFVCDWFVTQKQVKIWHDEDDYYDDETIWW